MCRLVGMGQYILILLFQLGFIWNTLYTNYHFLHFSSTVYKLSFCHSDSLVPLLWYIIYVNCHEITITAYRTYNISAGVDNSVQFVVFLDLVVVFKCGGGLSVPQMQFKLHFHKVSGQCHHSLLCTFFSSDRHACIFLINLSKKSHKQWSCVQYYCLGVDQTMTNNLPSANKVLFKTSLKRVKFSFRS